MSDHLQPPDIPGAYYPPAAPPKRGAPAWGWVLGGCGCLGLFFFVLLPAILFPVFVQARERARTTTCLSNLKQASLATLMYVQDYDERLPISTEWMDVTSPYIKNDTVFHCPAVGRRSEDVFGYAFDSRLSGKLQAKIAEPGRTLMIFDSTNTERNATDAGTSLDFTNPRHVRSAAGGGAGKGNAVSRLDGSALVISNLTELNLPAPSTAPKVGADAD